AAPPSNNASGPNSAAFPLLLPVNASVPRGNGRLTTITRRNGRCGKRLMMTICVGCVGGGLPRFVTGTVCGTVPPPGLVVGGLVWGVVVPGFDVVGFVLGVNSWKLCVFVKSIFLRRLFGLQFAPLPENTCVNLNHART